MGPAGEREGCRGKKKGSGNVREGQRLPEGDGGRQQWGRRFQGGRVLPTTHSPECGPHGMTEATLVTGLQSVATRKAPTDNEGPSWADSAECITRQITLGGRELRRRPRLQPMRSSRQVSRRYTTATAPHGNTQTGAHPANTPCEALPRPPRASSQHFHSAGQTHRRATRA